MTVEDNVLDVVREYYELRRMTYTPDVVLNGPDDFYGEDAEQLVCLAARRIGIPIAALPRSFLFDTYFEPEPPVFSPFAVFLTVFGRFLLIVGFLPLPVSGRRTYEQKRVP
jgi:hypothetical protein